MPARRAQTRTGAASWGAGIEGQATRHSRPRPGRARWLWSGRGQVLGRKLAPPMHKTRGAGQVGRGASCAVEGLASAQARPLWARWL
jgi:hypothetical protein